MGADHHAAALFLLDAQDQILYLASDFRIKVRSRFIQEKQFRAV
jgi:hypothetical protein